MRIPEDTFTPTTAAQTGAKSILILTDDKVEDLEFYYPYYRFIEEGFAVDVATPDGGEFKGKNGYTFKNALKLAEVDAEDYDMLYIPGGKAPEGLKAEDEALALVRKFASTGKPIAAICHGPQVLAAADLVRGMQISGWPEIEDEISKAGGIFVNEETIMDGQFITARWPADLPVHLRRSLEVLGGTASVYTKPDMTKPDMESRTRFPI